MNEAENLVLRGMQIGIVDLATQIQKLSAKVSAPPAAFTLPEWVNLETAAKLKGGAALGTYQTRLFLQPCCGLNYKLVGGRKCWKKDEVIRWIGVTDADLKAYADEWKVDIPRNYKERSREAQK